MNLEEQIKNALKPTIEDLNKKLDNLISSQTKAETLEEKRSGVENYLTENAKLGGKGLIEKKETNKESPDLLGGKTI